MRLSIFVLAAALALGASVASATDCYPAGFNTGAGFEYDPHLNRTKPNMELWDYRGVRLNLTEREANMPTPDVSPHLNRTKPNMELWDFRGVHLNVGPAERR